MAGDGREAEEYVRLIRKAEEMLGTGDRHVMPSEQGYERYKAKPQVRG